MRVGGMTLAWSRPPVLGRTSGVGVWSGNGRLEQGPHSGSRVCRRLERKPHAGLGAWARGIGDVWSGRPTQGQECEDVRSGNPTQSQECEDFWIGSRGQGHGGCLEKEPHLGPGV